MPQKCTMLQCHPGSLAATQYNLLAALSRLHLINSITSQLPMAADTLQEGLLHLPKKATRLVASTNWGQPFSLMCSGRASHERAIAAAVSSVCMPMNNELSAF